MAEQDTVLIENITEVTRQEKALKESEENFRKIFHESSIWHSSYSLCGKIRRSIKQALISSIEAQAH
jgi:hypothetical protein